MRIFYRAQACGAATPTLWVSELSMVAWTIAASLFAINGCRDGKRR
jgi:hypothetical protein